MRSAASGIDVRESTGSPFARGEPREQEVLNRLDHRNPLVFDVTELGRRPGSMTKVSRTVPAPADLGIEVIGVPEGTTVGLDMRLESVMEGVLVTGTAHARLKGECVRCLEPVGRELDAEFQEMYAYPESDRRGSDAEDGDEGETLTLEGDLFDLEPVLRDAVVLALPLQPVCRDDCPGLCSQCGFRLADDPEHDHETVDIRWAALQEFAVSSGDGGHDHHSGADRGADENQEK